MKKISLVLLILATTSLMAIDGATVFSKCAKCHGNRGQHRAFGISPKIGGFPVKQTVSILEIFKKMSGVDKFAKVMNKQVADLSQEEIQAVAKYISKLK